MGDIRDFDKLGWKLEEAINRSWDNLVAGLGKGYDASDLARWAQASVKLREGLMYLPAIRYYLEDPPTLPTPAKRLLPRK
jgi:hypothetical protein